MRVFITGCKGQLGRALYETLTTHAVAGCDLPEADITDRSGITRAIESYAPHVVIHAAAWTDVDGCARDPARAYRVNAIGTQNVALACASVGAELVTISTNEVFDGQSEEPYQEWDDLRPMNAYGRSKAGAEWFTRHLLSRFYIVRTAWLYASGGSNFPHRIIELADERGRLSVVTDEVGNPTLAPDLASALARLIETHAYGVYHLTNAGDASRYAFAREILDLTGRGHVPVEPITRDAFRRDSTPPPFAPLANTAAAALGIQMRPWQEALAAFLEESDVP